MQNHTEQPDSTARPLGYWLRAVDALLAREFATAFEAEGVTRRDWRILNLLGGDVVAPELAERLQRRGKKLAGLVERGWIAESDGEFTLTDAGRAAKDRLGETVAGIRARVSGAVSEADFATTLASLQSIATELGWDPEERMPRGPRHRGHGRGRAFGPGFGRGFGHGRPFGPGHGDSGFGRPAFGPDDHRGHGEPGIDHGCNHGHRSGRAHGHGHRHAERAYERGFAAGFDRGSAPREA